MKMTDKKKTIIINEIKYWKQSRLLPEKYCDYLLTLYTEGEYDFEQETSKSLQRKLKDPKRIFFYLHILFHVSLLPLSYLVLYFTEIALHLQIALILLFIIINLLATWVLYKRNHSIYQVPLLVAVLICFMTSLFVAVTLFAGMNIVILAILLLNCIIWYGTGFLFSLKYLRIVSILGAILLISYYIYVSI